MDHNQSSLIGESLDYAAEEDYGESFSSRHRLDQIAEGSVASAAEASGERNGDAGPEKVHPHREMNGVAGNDAKVEQNGTHSALGTASPSQNGEWTNRKLAKVKLWDTGDASTEPSVVTVAIDIPIREGTANGDDPSLGVGRKIELFQQSTTDGKEAVNITWQPQPKPIEEPWQPPFEVSKEEEEQSKQPQSASVETHSPVPSDHPSLPKTDPGSANENAEKPKPPVKGLEPFTIPSILSSTVIKRTPTEKVGLAFRKAHGTVVIEKIVPGSAFDGTALRAGYECLCINGHRLRSARRAAEIVRESGSSLTLMASNAPRPPGTMYTMITLDNKSRFMSSGGDHAVGMHFKMKHGLVQLVGVDSESPIESTSMRVGDFLLAINGLVVGGVAKAVEVLSESNDDLVPILFFSMRQLRVSLVDKVIPGDLWKKEWSEGYDECVVLQPGGESSNPLTLRFRESDGVCELLALRAFRDQSSSEDVMSAVPPDHPLHSVVETLNHGIVCVLSAICEGVELATERPSLVNGETKSDGDLMGELSKLSDMYREGLLSKDDFEAIKSRLLKSGQ